MKGQYKYSIFCCLENIYTGIRFFSKALLLFVKDDKMKATRDVLYCD